MTGRPTSRSHHPARTRPIPQLSAATGDVAAQLFTNRWLWAAIGASIVLQLLVLGVPAL